MGGGGNELEISSHNLLIIALFVINNIAHIGVMQISRLDKLLL